MTTHNSSCSDPVWN